MDNNPYLYKIGFTKAYEETLKELDKPTDKLDKQKIKHLLEVLSDAFEQRGYELMGDDL